MRRFVQAFVPETLPTEFGERVLSVLGEAPQRYNVAAHAQACVLRGGDDGVVADDMQWGLVPSWSREPRVPYTTVTARLDRAPTSRVYRSAWASRRCVVPMTGYYKWDRSRRPARPYFIQPRDGSLLLAAALWDRWPADAPTLHTFAILTTANSAIPAPLVRDGPVFLAPAQAVAWITAEKPDGSWLRRVRQPALEAYPVSRRIRRLDVDDYTLLEPCHDVDDTGDDGLLDDDE